MAKAMGEKNKNQYLVFRRSNGNLVNAENIRNQLIKDGAIFQSTSDTETILQLVARSRNKLIKDKL